MRYPRELVDKWRIEEGEFVTHVSYVGCHGVQRVFPEFANQEPSGPDSLVQVFEQALQEFLGVMLDSIEAYPLNRYLTVEPGSPCLDVRYYFWVSVVNIGEPERDMSAYSRKR